MTDYPEHEKLHKIADKSQSIGEFVEWMQGEKGIVFGSYHEHDDGCMGSGGFRVCGLRKDELCPTRVNIRTLLAEFFGIDESKIEAEKRQMLDEMRAVHK